MKQTFNIVYKGIDISVNAVMDQDVFTEPEILIEGVDIYLLLDTQDKGTSILGNIYDLASRVDPERKDGLEQ